MIPTRHDAVQVDFDNAQARLKVRNMDVFDDHDLANSLTQGRDSRQLRCLQTEFHRFSQFERRFRSTSCGMAPSTPHNSPTPPSSSREHFLPRRRQSNGRRSRRDFRSSRNRPTRPEICFLFLDASKMECFSCKSIVPTQPQGTMRLCPGRGPG